MKKIKCILLCTNANAWYYDMLLSCKDLEIYHLDFSILELDIPNPYNLETIAKAQVCFVCREWLKWITTKYSTNNTEYFINKIRKISNI